MPSMRIQWGIAGAFAYAACATGVDTTESYTGATDFEPTLAGTGGLAAGGQGGLGNTTQRGDQVTVTLGASNMESTAASGDAVGGTSPDPEADATTTAVGESTGVGGTPAAGGQGGSSTSAGEATDGLGSGGSLGGSGATDGSLADCLRSEPLDGVLCGGDYPHFYHCDIAPTGCAERSQDSPPTYCCPAGT